MMASLRAAWARWSDADLMLLLRVFLFAIAVPALLRLKLARLDRLLSRVPMGKRADPAKVRALTRCVTIVLHRGQPLVRPGCLTRGLTLYYFLRRLGLDVDLCFGAGYRGATFAAHCWLERGGEPFQEAGDPRQSFAEMYRLPGGAAGSARTAQAAGLPR